MTFTMYTWYMCDPHTYGPASKRCPVAHAIHSPSILFTCWTVAIEVTSDMHLVHQPMSVVQFTMGVG